MTAVPMGGPGDALLPAIPFWRRGWTRSGVRRIAIVLVLCGGWQAYAAWLDNPLLFPTCGQTLAAWYQGMMSGELPARTLASVELLVKGYAVGVGLAALLTIFAVSFRIGEDLLSTLTAMLGPLPGIALLPLALMWLGLGAPSMIFVLAYSVLWPLALSAHAGLSAVPETLRLVGRNYGLGQTRLAVLILAPAAFPALLGGLKIGWAFAWRTLIAAELVFGVSARDGGLGWYIYTAKNQLETADVFAGLLTVMLLGLVMESVVFRAIEARTVKRWGMQR